MVFSVGAVPAVPAACLWAHAGARVYRCVTREAVSLAL